MTKTSFPRFSTEGAAILGVSALVLTGCSASAPAAPDSSAGAAPAQVSPAAAGTCGSVPTDAANDPNGLLADFPEEIAEGYNLYPYEIRKSAWAGYKSPKEGGFTAAIVGMPPASPFIASMSEAIRTSLQDNGVKIVGDFAPDDPSNVPLQLQQFNEALSLKPDVIIYTAIAPQPSVGLAKAAHDAGIPLVAAQIPIDSEFAVSVTRNTPLAVAQVTAGTVGALGGKGTVLRVEGIPGIPASTFANMGIDAVLKNCPEIKVAGSVTGFFQPATAQVEVQKFLATNPAGVDGVLQAGTMGVGIRNAFEESGMEVPPIADDGSSHGFSSWALANPDYPFFGTTTPSVRTGEAVVDVALRILKGDGPKINQIVQPSVIVSRENLATMADRSWNHNDLTDLAGAPEDYLPIDRLNEFFTQSDK
ncbi:substrate-binding domain-containing protein [Arthrobacter sp. EH-1B-1]|uniref:Substrate-binding domain-containing protein n=1 Tax=Arthrobacter vasquezii TaxID=2977629 RepID=A0ABT6CV25_9MICC|nr:substrate-binding domain-containing protein [Arthrobacter vasquezii]MDF9277923.1 substrate-binding domain-containing protein [Arthrobacter vasquezii]